MRVFRLMFLTPILVILAAACGGDEGDEEETPVPQAQGATVQVAQHAQLGPVLVDIAGRTLYRFANDTAGASACTGGCAQTWPPLVLASGQEPTAGPGLPGRLETIARADGTKQVTYDGMPLYRYSGDAAAGDANGQGVGGVWFVVAPTGSAALSPTPSPTQAGGGRSSY